MATAAFWGEETDKDLLVNAESNHYEDRPTIKAMQTRADYKKTYFVRHLDTGAIKIGRSKNPEWRLSELQRAFGGRMALIGYIKEHSGETILLGYLQPWSLGSEWFRPSDEVLGVVHACLEHGYESGLALARYFSFANRKSSEVD